MTKNIVKLAALPSVFGLVALSMSVKDAEKPSQNSTEGLELFYTVPQVDETETVELDHSLNINLATTGKSFTGFKEALGFKESQNDYKRINQLGYLGKYQFGRSTLLLLGITDTDAFLNDPVLQEKAFIANASRNKWVLRKDIKRFSGKVINGVKVTESGILAAAHLAGPGSVKSYLRSGGVEGFKDAFGTSIYSYIKKFGGYDVSFIVPDRNAKVNLEK
ncbi:peptidoglycan-binding protein LysM [Leeuwenhoekiella parthenopeia]|uniref:Peptidoglycan-binding protein LysM n=1 Tax=Leeuwenhoekiella parthenopeia TaxID=2890320 RepID=A0ABS8GTD2_9FLAO|nr:peptidoglycan-binding protein LysM [Leeuwenhoekiella parthenopeia]MCC4212386.1 peptidoglycan-binding protein LysM [Leeuwenhoekiella parthenopeia]